MPRCEIPEDTSTGGGSDLSGIEAGHGIEVQSSASSALVAVRLSANSGNALAFDADGGLYGAGGGSGSGGGSGPAGPQGAPGATGPAGAQGPPGPKGDPGEDGEDGTAATIAVGTTTTGAAGSPAKVTNRGTPSAAIFDFTLPAGATGAAGAAGAAGPAGPAGEAATVSLGSVATADSESPASITNVGSDQHARFNFVLPRGAVGPAGPTGPKGDAATVEVSATNTLPPGDAAYVTNTGDNRAAKLIFNIPRGATGPKGADSTVPGPKGDAATVEVSATNTLTPGLDAYVTNTGDTHDARLIFNIPRGDPGPTGPPGSTGPAGQAATVSVKKVNTGAAGSDAIIYNDGTAQNAALVFNIPRGDKGDVGPTGPAGATGPQGQAATIKVNKVNTLAPGTEATAANVGTSTAAELVFGIPRGEKGDTGQTGATGPAGPATPIRVGATVTTNPGTDAEVYNTGNSSNVELVFHIPRGDAGPQGQTGATGPRGLTGATGDTGPRGEQGPQGIQGPAGPTGSKGDQGAQGNAGTIAIRNVYTRDPVSQGGYANVTNVGSTSAAILDIDLPRGEPGVTGPAGSTGPAGPTGSTGATGPAGTVAIGTTSTGAAGTNAAVTNSGTPSAAVLNFTIPQGPQGPAGPTGPAGAAGNTGDVLAGQGITVTPNVSDSTPGTTLALLGSAWTVTSSGVNLSGTQTLLTGLGNVQLLAGFRYVFEFSVDLYNSAAGGYYTYAAILYGGATPANNTIYASQMAAGATANAAGAAPLRLRTPPMLISELGSAGLAAGTWEPRLQVTAFTGAAAAASLTDYTTTLRPKYWAVYRVG